ncbi:MAG: serine/threonine-protein kinase [bacterium]
MVICPHCQTVNHPTSVACAGCGAPLGVDAALGGDPFIGRTLGGGRFTLQSVVGSGEIGMVYRGTDSRTGQAVAIKIVHPDVAATHGDELLRSASAVARLRHAKIATVLAAAREPDGTTFIVTEFIEGETLRDMLGAAGPLGPRRAADILFQLCSALAPFHRAGRPHANLKPENVFLARRDDGADAVQVVDAGSPDLFGVRETVGGHIIVGNPKYFSPEQVLGEPVGLASDLFTLGVIGYQLLSGALPFFGATPDQLLDAIVNGTPTPVEHRTAGTLPPRLAAAIRRCLAKRAEDRFPDLRALATELAAVIKASAPAAPPKRRFGGGAMPSTVIADVNALGALMEEEDEDRTVARALDDDALLNLDMAMDTGALLSGPEALDDIPEPLLFTGALDGDALRSALADATAKAAASVEKEAPRARPAPAAADPMQAALAAAMAEVDDDAPPRSVPPGDIPQLNQVGQVSDGFDPFAGMNAPAAPAAAAAPERPKPTSARPKPRLADAILDAMDEVAVMPAPSAAPLATAADFAAIAPPTLTTSGALEALPPPPPARTGGGARIAIAAVLLAVLGGGGYFAYTTFLAEPDLTPTTPAPTRRASAPTDALAATPGSGAAVPTAGAAAAPSSAGAEAVASEAPAVPPLQVTLTSTPPKADVLEGDKVIGQTPLPLTFAAEDGPRAFTVRLAGHTDAEQTVDPAALRSEDAKGEPVEVAVRLKKRPVARNRDGAGDRRKPPRVENPYKIENPY